MQSSRTLAPLSVLLLSCLLASCGGCSLAFPGGGGRTVTLLAYNVENFFDDVHNGTEYREYDPAGGDWNTELFHVKMQHLAEVLRTVARGGADIVALEEVENENALDVLNSTYLKGLGYRAFSGESGRSAVVVGLLSRLPVSDIRMHRIESDGSEPLRDIMEARIDCHGRTLVLFINHWKSKLGGADITEPARRAAAGLLVRRIRSIAEEEPSTAIVVAGDLNENWDEYTRIGGRYRTALLPDVADLPPAVEDGIFLTGRANAARIEAGRVVLYSPWSERVGQGSYWYGGGWETIDQFLAGPRLFDGSGVEYDSFEVVRLGYLLTAAGYPFGWSSDRAVGYSDHLPLLLTLSTIS